MIIALLLFVVSVSMNQKIAQMIAIATVTRMRKMMMTDDIVKELRKSKWNENPSTNVMLCEEAADEIERLRAELLEAQQGLGLLRRSRDRRDDEIERLRTERDQWRKTAAAYRYCGKCDWCEEQWDKATGNEQN